MARMQWYKVGLAQKPDIYRYTRSTRWHKNQTYTVVPKVAGTVIMLYETQIYFWDSVVVRLS